MEELDTNEKDFQIVNEDTSKVQYGTETGDPPLVIVVQGGRNVNLILTKLVWQINFN